MMADDRHKNRTVTKAFSCLTLLYAGACLLPVLFLFWSWESFNRENWQHLLEYLLPQAAGRTLLLCGLVLVMTAVLGIGCAWLVGCFEFPGRRFFRIMLTMPLALPNYVIGFAVLSLIDYGGPLGSFDRWAGTKLALWLHANSYLPAAFSLTFALFPYVYLMTLAAIEHQGRGPIEAAMVDGASAGQLLRQIILPLALPAASAGLLLVMMETLADFGTVALYSYDTFAVVIYKVWYGLFDLDTASQLSVGVVLFLLPLFLLRLRWMQKAAATLTVEYHRIGRRPLTGWPRVLAGCVAGGVLFFSFILPLSALAVMSARTWPTLENALPVVGHTLMFALLAAAAALVSSTVQTFLRARAGGRPWRLLLIEHANMGYALPGTILAVGVLQVVSRLGPVVSGTVIAVVIGLTCRFQIISAQSLWSGFVKIPRSLTESARIDGAGLLRRARDVYAPLMQSHFAVAFILVFLEAAKEMPITLMTRPFGHDTLAVKIFQFTSEGEYGMAAAPALLLAVIGLIPQLIFILRRANTPIRS